MPNKRINDLKDSTMRQAGQEWQDALGIDDMTTREWDEAVYMQHDLGYSDDETREEILKSRRKTFF